MTISKENGVSRKTGPNTKIPKIRPASITTSSPTRIGLNGIDSLITRFTPETQVKITQSVENCS